MKKIYVISMIVLLELSLSASSAIDITNKVLDNKSISCSEYANNYLSFVKDVKKHRNFRGSVSITANSSSCLFRSNNIPNHDFDDEEAHFATPVRPQRQIFEITTKPRFATMITPLSLRVDNAVMLNGVKIDILAAACYGVRDEKIGCFKMSTPWRLDPMSPINSFGTDSHNAHTQANGAYHYHGSPNALYDDAKESVVIGFAADGFAISSPYIKEDGKIRKVKPSYRLKQGNRVEINGVNPGGTYNGKYRDDYEFISGLGDLDECNGGMINGKYSYYITETFPYVLACFKGTPNLSFTKHLKRKRRINAKRLLKGKAITQTTN